MRHSKKEVRLPYDLEQQHRSHQAMLACLRLCTRHAEAFSQLPHSDNSVGKVTALTLQCPRKRQSSISWHDAVNCERRFFISAALISLHTQCCQFFPHFCQLDSQVLLGVCPCRGENGRRTPHVALTHFRQQAHHLQAGVWGVQLTNVQ